MRLAGTLVAVVLLAGCGVSSTDGVVSREENSGGFLGLSTREPIEVDGDSAFKSVQKVVVGSFKVGFVESSANSNKAGGGLLGGGGFGGKATGNARLDGVSDAQKQAITEAAYKDFISKLQASGYQVVDRSGFVASSQYEGAKKYEFPYNSDDSSFLSSYGVTKFYQPSSFGSQGVFFMNDIQGVTGGFAFGNGQLAAAEYATANGVAVVGATYVVDFASTDGHGGRWSTTASIQVGQNLAVTSGNVKFVVGTSSSFTNGTGTLTLGQPIASTETFGTVETTTSDANVAVQETLNVLSVLTGGGSSRSREYTIHADGAKYSTISQGLLTQANSKMLSKASALR